MARHHDLHGEFFKKNSISRKNSNCVAYFLTTLIKKLPNYYKLGKSSYV